MMPDAKNKKLVAEQSFAGYEFSAYMGGKGMDKSLVNKARRILASVLIAAVCVCNMAVPAFAEEAIAASFRLYQTEGTVTVQNQNGKEMTAMQDMKLFNGYQVSTEQKSYAWFEADSTKLFKMDAVSNLEVRKKGKQSELLLNSGNLFFNVTEHLQDDEVLNIRTSSMVVGIRGTSGWVKVIDQYHTILYMLEGSVEASVTDPVSGQRKSITLRGGQRAEFWIYDKNKEGDKCDIIVRQYGEEEIDGFVAVELKKNQQLQERIRGGGGSGAGGSAGGGTGAGFDLVSTIAKAEERLKQDQEEVARKLEEIKKQLAGLAHKVDVDPVFSNNTSKDDSGSDGGASGGSATETVADPTTLTMPVDDITVHDYLNNKKVSVILQPSANANENNFAVANGLTVPSGKSLTIQNGISTSVESGKTLQVDGHMETAEDLVNAGTVNVTSTDTLIVQGALHNSSILNNTGRIVIKGTLTNTGTITNKNKFVVTDSAGSVMDGNQGTITVNGGAIEIYDGIVDALNVTNGTAIVAGGTVNHVDVKEGGSFTLESAKEPGDAVLANGLKIEANGTANLKKGTVESGSEKALSVEGMLYWNPDDKSNMIVYAKDADASEAAGNLLQISDSGVIQYSSVNGTTVQLKAGTMFTLSEAAPYTVDSIYATPEQALTDYHGRETVCLSGDTKILDNSATLECTGAGNKTINLLGYKLDLQCSLRIGKQKPPGMILNPNLTIYGDTGKDLLVLNGDITIGDWGSLTLKNLQCQRENASITLEGGGKLCLGPDDGKVTIKNDYSFREDPFIKGIRNDTAGSATIDIGNLECIDMKHTFLDTENAIRELKITKCILTAGEEINGPIIKFDSTGQTNANDFDLETIKCIEELVISSKSTAYGPIKNLVPEKFKYPGPNKQYMEFPCELMKASANEDGNIKIYSKCANETYLTEIDSFLNEYLRTDQYEYRPNSKGYYALVPKQETPQPQLLAIPLRPVVDEIVDSSLLATKNDADIIDEDFGYEEEEDEENLKATPNNAIWNNDEIVDEDEPYQDSDDEDDDEPRNIPVKSVTPAIPSTSTKDIVPSEEDPDPKKNENPDTNNPEKEENQNGDPDSDPEEEPEPEKEQADLLHTEPSNVPDQREEEES